MGGGGVAVGVCGVYLVDYAVNGKFSMLFSYIFLTTVAL